MRTKGFTLIELMIVVVIIAILSAIAYPNYQAYVIRANRAMAKAELLEVAVRQEHFFLNNKTYANNLNVQLGYLANPYFIDKEGVGLAVAGNIGIYSIAIAVPANGLNYTVTATPVNIQLLRDAACGALTLDDRGARTPLIPVACWTK